jgi:hypothetical protein
MLPWDVKCAWAGMGGLGCIENGGCESWYAGYSTTLSVLMHELGHNFNLCHSSAGRDEYGDQTCVMGGASKCFNAPQMYTMGIGRPIVTLNIDSMRNGRWYTYEVPQYTSDRINFIKVDMNSGNNAFYVSFLGRTTYLSNQYQNVVAVHRYYQTPLPPNTCKTPQALNFLRTGTTSSFRERGRSIKVSFDQYINTIATVRVCSGC